MPGHIEEEFRFLGNFTNNFNFLGKFPKIFDFVSGNFTKKSFFQGKFAKNFEFFQIILYKIPIFHGKFPKNIDFPGKNWLFTAISGQIILFLFKSHHFRTYFLYMIRYNNILRPVHDPTTAPMTPLPKIWGSRPPKPPGLTSMTKETG